MKMIEFLMTVAVCAAMIQFSLATNHVVGSPGGAWDEMTNFEEWAKPIHFATGDNLVFEYSNFHDVMEVTKPDYDDCETSNPLVTDESGKTVVPLKKPGKRYFICGVQGHCKMGMKLEINVIEKHVLHSSTPTPIESSATPTESSAAVSTLASSPDISPAIPPSTVPSSPTPTTTTTTGPTAPQQSSAVRAHNVEAVIVLFVAVFSVIAF